MRAAGRGLDATLALLDAHPQPKHFCMNVQYESLLHIGRFPRTSFYGIQQALYHKSGFSELFPRIKVTYTNKLLRHQIYFSM